MTTTYWKNINSGMIYIYHGLCKPLNWEHDWRQVSAWEYDEALRKAHKAWKEANA